ncbi:hypothetical protein [Burkholderia sp. Bp9031]|uniref:hypothetical protein n=1 Tax=Burkholderia sp. Bp9031 TaxID=2184566 RepID=UPI000F5E05E6|nr:hypothetical protein [Burkholderia sp. Bp9031]
MRPRIAGRPAGVRPSPFATGRITLRRTRGTSSFLSPAFIGNGVPPRIALLHLFTIFPAMRHAACALDRAMQHAPDNIFSLSFKFRFVIIESICRQ